MYIQSWQPEFKGSIDKLKRAENIARDSLLVCMESGLTQDGFKKANKPNQLFFLSLQIQMW